MNILIITLAALFALSLAAALVGVIIEARKAPSHQSLIPSNQNLTIIGDGAWSIPQSENPKSARIAHMDRVRV